MQTETITERQRKIAQRCLHCIVCSHARKKQKGIAFWLVKKVESRLCSFCKAYEKVSGRKAHEPISASDDTKRA